MLESMKVLGFIPESKAIKLYKNAEGKVVGERYDKVTYLREFLNFTLEGEGVAMWKPRVSFHFFPLFQEQRLKKIIWKSC